jgi:putative ABC transport system ATP-binding protein
LSISRLDIPRRAKLAFIGESGSGKSTLLELLAMILEPDASGEFSFRPVADAPAHDLEAIWSAADADRLSDLRSRYVGYVLQYGGLLPYLTVRENIELPRKLLELPGAGTADRLAAKLGIVQQLERLPAALSVGQRQRTAIARALAHEPPIVIADEPTAAVDPLNAERIVRMLADLTDELGVTLILSTHAHHLIEKAGFEAIEHRVTATDEQTMTVSVSTA